MALTIEIQENGYFEAVDEMLSAAFFPPDGVDSAELYRGPSFGVWALRNQEDRNNIRRDIVFDNRNRNSLFFFAQKHAHLQAVDKFAIVITTTCRGRPIYANQIGAREALFRFIAEVDSRFDDSYWVRYIQAPRGRDAIAISRGVDNIFVPIIAGLQDQWMSMDVDEYIQYSGLTP
jgi:hypothetical protein